ncbi:MAG: hypothetical protein CYPHOPRED_002284, partial [Cyphobasidiales sp. Tagirdzhanova-0007]
ILSQRTYEPVDGGLKEKDKLLFEEVKRSAKVDINSLSAEHVLTDGRGQLLLVKALLNPSSIASLPYENLVDLPRQEDTMDIRPAWSHFIPILLREVILPHYPRFIQNFFAAKPYWPQGEIVRDPTTVPEASSLIELPGDVLTAYLVAMWSVFIRTSSKDQRLTASWPADERIPSLGHPYCTGMYISNYEDDIPISPPSDFWTEAARTYAYTASAAGRQHALGGSGLLEYIPDHDPEKLNLIHGPTEWEDFLLSSASGQSAVRYSLGFSNLGYVDLPAGANDVMWTQNCWPLGMALIANVIGHRNGLRVVSIWMEGAMVTEDQVKKVEKTFVKILERLTDPRWNKTSRTRVPVYEQLPKPWPASDILFQRRYEPVDGGLKEKHKLLSKEVKRSSTVDIDVSPLWQVSLYTAPTKTGPVYLTLSADHALTDGRGLLLLLEALLNPSSIASLPYESLIELPLHEDTMDMRPTWSQLLPPVLRRIILPHFPQFIQNFFAAKPYWPQGEIMRDPTTVPEASSLIELPGDVLARLKVAGKEHNVPTLNATVMTAYLVAMWSVHIRTSSKDQRLTAAWPADERIPSLGHPYCTGMYISSFNDNFPLSPPADFWTEAARTYAYTTSAAGRKQARGAIGILGYIPDRDPANLELKHSATEWEDLTLSSASGQSAVRYSLGFSNLGYVDLPAGANDVMWTQNCWPLGMALIANVIGHRNGLRVVSIWMEGAMVTEDQVKEVEETFVKILERLTDPRWNKTRWEELVS